MSQIIAIASGKGGVGKTLVTASLAVTLARRGCTVLAADADMGLRNLDLLFGVQDEVLYDAVDIMKRRCSAAEAVIPLSPYLDFLAASQKHTWEKVYAPGFQYTLDTLSRTYDYILIDCPPGRGNAYKDAVAIADMVFFVVEPTWSSLRDTGRVMQFCNKHKQFNYAVVFNNFYASRPGYVSPDEAVAALNAEHVADLLPHDDLVHAAGQDGEIMHVSGANPFFQSLSLMCDALLEERPFAWDEAIALLPSAGTAAVEADESVSKTDEPALTLPAAAIEELRQAAASLSPDMTGPSPVEEDKTEPELEVADVQAGSQAVLSLAPRLSVRQRRDQSRAWRSYRR